MTEQDIDRLEALLASDTFKGEAMPLDTLQGFLCAVASGPEEIPPAEWLPEVLGPDPDYASPTAQQDAEAAVLAFYQSVRAELAAGEDFDLILYAVEEGSEELDYAAWCDGYVYGCQMGQRDWFAHLDRAGFDLLVETDRLSGGLHAELFKQGTLADLELFQGSRTPVGCQVQLHHSAVGALFKRCQGNVALGILDRLFDLMTGAKTGQQVFHRAEQGGVHLLTLEDNPLLEALAVIYIDAFHELAVIQVHRILQAAGTGWAGFQALMRVGQGEMNMAAKSAHVGPVQAARVELDGFVGDDQEGVGVL
jgi:yecA family protein